jgi:hypothetical protein
MSLAKEKPFIALLLHTTLEQARALLYTLTDQQTQAISEIFFNLPHLPSSQAVKKLISRRKRVIAKIGNRKYNTRTRKSLIKKHMNQTISTLRAVKKEMKQLL